MAAAWFLCLTFNEILFKGYEYGNSLEIWVYVLQI
jgi:hypothetical protein